MSYGSMDSFTDHSVLVGYTQQEKYDAVLQKGKASSSHKWCKSCNCYDLLACNKARGRTFSSGSIRSSNGRTSRRVGWKPHADAINPSTMAVLANVLEIPRQGRVCAHQSQYTLQRPDFSFNCHVTDAA